MKKPGKTKKSDDEDVAGRVVKRTIKWDDFYKANPHIPRRPEHMEGATPPQKTKPVEAPAPPPPSPEPPSPLHLLLEAVGSGKVMNMGDGVWVKRRRFGNLVKQRLAEIPLPLHAAALQLGFNGRGQFYHVLKGYARWNATRLQRLLDLLRITPERMLAELTPT